MVNKFSPQSPNPAESKPVTLSQLLDLVEQAVRGNKTLSQQLFAVFMQMQLQPTTPANEKALADVLTRILIGDDSPSLDALDIEDQQPLQDLLQRLKVK